MFGHKMFSWVSTLGAMFSWLAAYQPEISAIAGLVAILAGIVSIFKKK